MIHLFSNTKAVSNIIGYLFSFITVFTVMTVSIVTTTSILDSKSVDVASLQAQSIANYVADTLVDVIAVVQSMPNANYSETLDIPLKLGGTKGYYIEVTDNAVYVNTTDGSVSKISTNYNEDLNIDISGKVYGGSSLINLFYQPHNVLYKIDFGTGNSISHSPVESGYYRFNISRIDNADDHYPEWDTESGYEYRVPIMINNTVPTSLENNYSAKNLSDIVIKIILDPSNFDYERSQVTFINQSHSPITNTYSESRALSNLKFIDENEDNIAYFIEYWNPNGSSVIYVKVPFLEVNTSKYIYLYYGSDDLVESGFDRNLGVSEFFEDFDKVNINWNKTYMSEILEVAYSVALDTYGYVYVVGYGTHLSGTGSARDWWIKKFDPNGYEITANWNKTYDANGSADVAFSVTTDSYDNVYVVGTGSDLNGSSQTDWWIKKFNQYGDEDTINWNKTYDANGSVDEAYSVAIDTNNDVYVVGDGIDLNGSTSREDWWIMKFNGATGVRNWNKTYHGGSDSDAAYGVATDGNNNVYVVGNGKKLNGSSTGGDWWVMRFNGATGVRNWNKTYDGGDDDIARSVAIDSNDDVYVVGSGEKLNGSSTDYDWWIMKFNGTTGSREWEKSYDGNGERDQAFSVATDINNYVYVVGSGENLSDSNTYMDWWIKKFDSNGDEYTTGWNITYDSNDGWDIAWSVTTDVNGNVYVVGASNYDWCIKKFDSDGNEYLNYTKLLDSDVWYISDNTIKDNISQSCIRLVNDEYIITRSYKIRDPTETTPLKKSGEKNESSYIVEMKYHINEGNGGMIPLSLSNDTYIISYLISTNSSNLSIWKFYDVDKMGLSQNVSKPYLDDWLRLRAYLYTLKISYNSSYINSFLYNFDTFAPYLNNVSLLDSDETGAHTLLDPVLSGYLGIGCNLMPDHAGTASNISVDWIRVLRTPPLFQPAVTIGSLETFNCGWFSNSGLSTVNREVYNPFYPGPVLCDFIYKDTGKTPNFVVSNLPSEISTVTVEVTKGDIDGSVAALGIYDSSDDLLASIPGTEAGIFKSTTFEITDDNDDKKVKFYFNAGNSEVVVNSLKIWAGGGITID